MYGKASFVVRENTIRLDKNNNKKNILPKKEFQEKLLNAYFV